MARLHWSKLLTPHRLRPTLEQGQAKDLRNPFEKDYHRIIQSASFRRLQDKTQVFPLDQSDFVRTRLTHSLEVSSLAKSLGQQVCRRLQEDGHPLAPTAQEAVELTDLLLCAGLVHDIGNPPYGHYGETTIRLWFKTNLPRLFFRGQSLEDLLTPQMKADFLAFEGNAQAVRVLAKLHFVKDAYGMNVTLPLLNTIIKYPVSSLEVDRDAAEITRHKMGYFYAERELYKRIVETTGTLEEAKEGEGVWPDAEGQLVFDPALRARRACRHPLTFLLEAADDISYCTADIEDAYKKNKLTFEQLQLSVQSFIRQNKNKYSSEQIEAAKQLLRRLGELRQQARKRKYTDPDLYGIQNWLIQVQSVLLEEVAAHFVSAYAEIMDGCYQQEICENVPHEIILRALSQIAYQYVFHSRQIFKMELAADQILSGLLDAFVPAAVVFDTEQPMTPVQERLMKIISANYLDCYHRESKGKSEVERLYLRLLLVTDYLSGMTDRFAKSLYQQLAGMD